MKVQTTALCGSYGFYSFPTFDIVVLLYPRLTHSPSSELHVFRGHQTSGTGFIMGHEFTGTVVEKGPEVQSVEIGDRVVSPFTVSW